MMLALSSVALRAGTIFRQVLAARLLDIHRHDALGRRVQIGQERKTSALVPEERKLILEIADQLLERRIGAARRIAHEHLVLRIGAAGRSRAPGTCHHRSQLTPKFQSGWSGRR